MLGQHRPQDRLSGGEESQARAEGDGQAAGGLQLGQGHQRQCGQSPEPRTAAGLYWGYTTRIAENISQVFTGCPHQAGYDLMLGTSEKGDNVDNLSLKPFKNLLIVFGGVGGLEAALEADGQLDVTDPKELFDHYINVCPDQGSRTIRTEEAILIAMSRLQSKIGKSQS